MAGAPTPEAIAVEHPRAVWLVTAAHAVNEFYSVALPPVLPLLRADFALSWGQAGALITVFFVMYSVFQLPAGMLADRVGQRRLLAGGMALLSGGLFVVASADSYLVMLAGQALAGVGGSTYHPSGMSLISDLESGATEGRAMGIHGFGGVTGMALSPVVVGGLAALYDWRLALSVAAVVGVAYAGVFLALFSAQASAADGGEPSGGDSEAVASSDLQSDGTRRASSDERGDSDGGERTAGSRTSSDGPADGASASLRDRARALVAVPAAGWVVGLFALSFLVSFEIGAVRTFAPTYLSTRLGDSVAVANGIYFVMLVGAGAASLGAGSLADRVDRTAAGALIFGGSAAMLAATALVPPSAVVMLGWFLALGVVLYAVSPMKNALTASYAEREFSGSLFGVMLSASSIGGALGPVLLGVVAERVGWAVTFPAIGLVAVLGVGVFVGLRRV